MVRVRLVMFQGPGKAATGSGFAVRMLSGGPGVRRMWSRGVDLGDRRDCWFEKHKAKKGLETRSATRSGARWGGEAVRGS